MKYQIFEKIKTKRSIGRRLWNLFGKLPMFIRAPIIRRLFSIDFDLPQNLVFKRAETYEEIEQAFKVAYEAYYERGLEDNSVARMRVTKHHALPTTCLLIGKIGDEVVATMTIIVDSALGLPIEKLWNIDEIRSSSVRMAEISNLAIKRGFRAQRGKLLLPLCGFMYRFCTQNLGVDNIVATFHPEVQDFYKCVLLFDELNEGEVKTYEFVKGAAAVGGVLNLPNIKTKYKEIYGKKASNRNLYQYFTLKKIDNYHFDTHKLTYCSRFTFTPSLLEYFFKNKTEAFDLLTQDEKSVIANAYFYPEYLAVILSGEINASDINRKEIRFAVNYNLKWNAEGYASSYDGKVLEISQKGVKISKPKDLELRSGVRATLHVSLPGGTEVPISAEVKWVRKAQLGLVLGQFVPKEWTDLVKLIEEDVVKAVLQTTDISKKIKKSA